MSSHNSLHHLIQSRSGIMLDEHRRNTLQRTLDEILAKDNIGWHGLELLLTVQPLSHTYWQDIISAITIGETYFFRNQAHMNALRNELLPKLLQEKRSAGIRQLRIWSAGCATGEEPYSIAMMLRDLIPDIDQWSITILATDINASFLERAKAGRFASRSFRGETPEWVQSRWFQPVGKEFQIDAAVRKMVNFAPLNLLDDVYPSLNNGTMHQDLILCRNVTIYFERQSTMRVVRGFHKSLVDGGWLIVGHSEPQAEVYDSFTVRNFERTVFYQKPSAPTMTRILTEMLTAGPKPPERTVVIAPPIAKASAPAKKPAPTVAIKPVEKAPPPPPKVVEKVNTYWHQAKEAANEEQWATALELLDHAEGDNILQPHIHYLRGLVRLQMGETTTAMAALRRAIYCDPDFALAHYTLGDLHARQGATQEAHRHWKQAVQVLKGYAPEDHLPYAEDDLTVEMLNGLLNFRLNDSPHSAGL